MLRAVRKDVLMVGVRRDFNHPPTAVGGIDPLFQRSCRSDLNYPPTAVGGISTFVQSFPG